MKEYIVAPAKMYARLDSLNELYKYVENFGKKSKAGYDIIEFCNTHNLEYEARGNYSVKITMSDEDTIALKLTVSNISVIEYDTFIESKTNLSNN